MMETESRDAVRVAAVVGATLHLSFLRDPLPASTRDISTLGACIATASPLDLSALERIRLELPGGPLTLRTEGRWQKASAEEKVIISGIRFRDVEPDQVAALSAFVLDRAKELALFLRGCAALSGLTLDQTHDLALQTRLASVSAGTRLGPPAPAPTETFTPIFVVYDGSIEMVAAENVGGRVPLGSLPRGGIFALSGATRAVAARDCVLLVISPEAFEYLSQSKPRVAIALREALLQSSTGHLEAALAALHGRTG